MFRKMGFTLPPNEPIVRTDKGCGTCQPWASDGPNAARTADPTIPHSAEPSILSYFS
jgi:hypothetical protein